MSYRHIVVGTDGSAGSLAAVEWAAATAKRTDASVTLVHGLSPWLELTFSLPPLNQDSLAAQTGDRLTAEWSEPLRKAGVDYGTKLVEDHAASALLAAADTTNADILVVGRHGRADWAPHVLGGVTHKLLHASLCPVVVVPPGWQRRATVNVGEVVVGVDGSESSLRALDWTIRHTQASEARIRIASAVFTQIYAEEAWLAKIDDEETIEKATRLLTGIIDRKRSGTAADIELVVRIGHVGEVLVETSQQAELLAVGSHGLGTVQAFLVGSAAQHAATFASCPVVIVT